MRELIVLLPSDSLSSQRLGFRPTALGKADAGKLPRRPGGKRTLSAERTQDLVRMVKTT